MDFKDDDLFLLDEICGNCKDGVFTRYYSVAEIKRDNNIITCNHCGTKYNVKGLDPQIWLRLEERK